MALTISTPVYTFLQQASQATMRTTGLGLYITHNTSNDTLTLTGGGALTLTTTGATNVTLPTTGTLISASGTATLTNKTFDTAGTGNSFSINGVAATANTGTGAVVRAVSPTLTTPILGVATVSSINGLTIGASSGTLSVDSGSFAFVGAFSCTLTFTAGTSVTFPTTGTLATRAGTETLTNKTLTSPVLTTPNIGVATATTVNGLTITATNSAALTIPNNCTLALSGGDDVTFTTVGGTALTLPQTGTLATLAGSETLSNKTLTTPVIGAATGTSLAVTGAVTSTGGMIGYATGAGGTVTQATNRTTGVTLNKLSGQITTNNASLAAEASADFVVTNSFCAITDVPVLAIQSGSNSGGTLVQVIGVGSGSFTIRVHNGNVAAGTAETGAIVINFVIIKGVAA